MNISDIFRNAAPVSQIVFVHDYLQIAFQDLLLTVYSPVTLALGAAEIRSSDPGFYDRLVGLIGKRPVQVEYSSREHLRLSFDGNEILTASLNSDSVIGPELFQVSGPGLPIVVEQVA
jgi:hypothetical protein